MLPSRALTPLIVACALFMENLDSTVLSTSLPAIAADLGENPIALKLAVTSYLLSLAVLIPASGWVADRFGARAIFRLAIAVFTLGSIWCGLSDSIGGLVGGRIVQGMGGALMTPVGRLIILRSVSKHDLVASLAWLSMPALIGPILGPVVGGFLTTYVSWRWIFWINVPIGVIGVALATRFLPDVRAEHPGRFDAVGFVLSGIGLTLGVVGSTSFGLGYWPLPVNLAFIAIGGAALALYVRHACRTEAPIIDLSLLRIQTFRASLLGGTAFRIGIGATPFLLPLLLQVGFGMTAFQSGLLTFAGGIGAFAMKVLAKPVLRLFGFRRVLIFNALISAFFISLPATYTALTPVLVIAGIALTGGFFRSLQFTSVNALAYGEIDQRRMGRATSFMGVAQQISISLGVSIGAMTVEASRHLRGGDELLQTDFQTGFVTVGLISALAALAFLRLPPTAGDEMSGRGTPQPDPITVSRER